MHRLFAAILILIALSGFPARAENLVNNVRQALGESDFPKLEDMFKEAHETALVEKSFYDLRDTYSVLFVTAHNDRLQRTKDWLAAYPNSPYAATGLAWMHYYRAFLLRGDRNWRDTSAEARQGFHNELVLAKKFTGLAIAQADDFLPAIDAAILLKATHIDDGSPQPLVNHALDIAPDRHALRLGLAAANLNWGGKFEENLALCGFMAAKIPDYDTELCLIEFVFENKLEGTFREMAIEALDGRDESFLDYARLDAYLHEWNARDEATTEAKRIHRASLGPDVNVVEYQQNLKSIVATFQLPFYGIEANDAFLTAMRDRLKDSPQNHKILRILIEDGLERVSREEYGAGLEDLSVMWREMLELGAFLPPTWGLGSGIGRADRTLLQNTERQARFHANAIHFGNHKPFWLKNYLMELFVTYQIAIGEEPSSRVDDADHEALHDAVLCPLFRVTRLYNYFCEADPSDAGCNIGGYGSNFPDRVRRIMKTSPQCEWAREAEIEELYFSPVPIERFFEETKK